MDLAVVALTFAAIAVVELPDKTFLATLVLSTRYRPLLVYLGVGLAFAVQTSVAVALGKVVALLPTTPVRVLAIVMFLVGAGAALPRGPLPPPGGRRRGLRGARPATSTAPGSSWRRSWCSSRRSGATSPSC